MLSYYNFVIYCNLLTFICCNISRYPIQIWFIVNINYLTLSLELRTELERKAANGIHGDKEVVFMNIET